MKTLARVILNSIGRKNADATCLVKLLVNDPPAVKEWNYGILESPEIEIGFQIQNIHHSLPWTCESGAQL